MPIEDIKPDKRCHRVFLGGSDLEMQTIRDLVVSFLGPDRLADKGLSWGASASQYGDELQQSLTRRDIPVLVELEDDLPRDFPREELVFVDHHSERAGQDRPSALRQVFDLLELPQAAWTRDYALVEANDIGHIQGLRLAGASAEEIRDIRTRDRRAQGIDPQIEQRSREAVRGARRRGRLTIVETELSTSSAIVDFLQPEFGGPGVENVLVIMPETISFFGAGSVIQTLSAVEGCWYGGALPERGYWGVSSRQDERRTEIIARITGLAA